MTDLGDRKYIGYLHIGSFQIMVEITTNPNWNQ